MQAVDFVIVSIYMLGVLSLGAFFFFRQSRPGEYFVADRKMTGSHIGLSVVATDVGGGFSIGLGGLGFVMGLSASWMLFMGLLGAWITAVILIPKVKALGDQHDWESYPDFLEHRFDGRTRLTAAILSALGYGAFVGAQILAGATLAVGAFGLGETSLAESMSSTWNVEPERAAIIFSALIMAAVVILYTAMGGLQAVVYTDTVQWIILFAGLFIALPVAYHQLGGWESIKATLPKGHLSMFHVSWWQMTVWAATILPIWFVAMTLYQRIYATRDVKTAQRAWFFAGLLEFPVLALLGASLGVLAKVAFFGEDILPETGLPRLLKDVLPVGMTGLVIAAYFSAIMSTADSCLLASVGNVIHDLYRKYVNRNAAPKRVLLLSRLLTIVIGAASLIIALGVKTVLEAIYLAYGFMAAGLFVPTVAALLWKRATASAAFWSMMFGGATAVVFTRWPDVNPLYVMAPTDLDSGATGLAALAAMPVSLVVIVAVSLMQAAPDAPSDETAIDERPVESRRP
jgi:SSS family solute:Na+ symporter